MEKQEKEQRTEYIGLYVTPTMAKELKLASDNKQLEDKIIKDFVTNETDWIKSQISEMDEINVLYRAKLLTIRDSFQKAQNTYIEEIEKMCDVPHTELQGLESKIQSIKNQTQSVKDEAKSLFYEVENISNKMKYINCEPIERLLNLVERFNQMGESDKELIRLMITKN